MSKNKYKEEKKAFLRKLNEFPCREGWSAFYAHKGDMYDYFLNHARGAAAFEWCVNSGMANVVGAQKVHEFCFTLIRKHGVYLRFIPSHYITPELCLEAVKSSPHALRYVPSKLRTVELCKLAIERDKFIAYCIPEDIRHLVI